jgi:hypothetical protein
LPFNFVGLYRGDSEPEQVGPTSSIHVAGIASITRGNYTLTFREKTSAPASWLSIPFSSLYRGFTVTVPPGEYEVWWKQVETGQEGRVTSGGSASLIVGEGTTSWENGQVNPSSPEQGAGSKSAALSGGAIAGIVVGVVVGVAAVIGLVVLLRPPAADGYGAELATV